MGGAQSAARGQLPPAVAALAKAASEAAAAAGKAGTEAAGARAPSAAAAPAATGDAAAVGAATVAGRRALVSRGEDRPFTGSGDETEVDVLARRGASEAERDVAHAVAADGAAAVSVTRIRPSRTLDAGDGSQLVPAPQLHAKDEAGLARLDAASGVVAHTDTSVGANAVRVFEAMQMNPRILDTAVALQSSRVHRIAAAMAVGKQHFLPPGTVVATAEGPRTVTAADAAATLQLEGRNPPALTGGSAAEAAVPTSLVPAARLESLIPLQATVETLLLRRPPPANVIAWPARPAEGSPYDQLVLRSPHEERMLERGELFELFARRRADPTYWTAQRLAKHYDTKVEWVEALLESAAPPLLVQVDGEAYGVYDIRPTSSEAAGGGPAAAGGSSTQLR